MTDPSDELRVTLVEVLPHDDRTRIDDVEDVMGWGVEFPSGGCYVDWNREAFDEEDRLRHPHVSIYGCPEDVEQGTGGTVRPMISLAVDPSEPVDVRSMTGERRRPNARVIDDV